jgi:hypothetical protein
VKPLKKNNIFDLGGFSHVDVNPVKPGQFFSNFKMKFAPPVHLSILQWNNFWQIFGKNRTQNYFNVEAIPLTFSV